MFASATTETLPTLPVADCPVTFTLTGTDTTPPSSANGEAASGENPNI